MIKKKKEAKVSEFIPQFPDKYIGKYPIICRSSWERMYAQWLDSNPFVVEWMSEGNVVPYFDPVKGKQRRYYPDFYAVVKNNGKSRKFLIEIKPYKETVPPKNTKRKSFKTKKHQEETHITNQAKWKAAKQYCKKMGYEFKVFTEKTLFLQEKR